MREKASISGAGEKIEKAITLGTTLEQCIATGPEATEKEADDVQIIYAFAEALFYTNNHSQFMHLLTAF